ncbi:MAG: squalene/phytoene synthase family protein [Acidimicrobiia bacterium]|nr:squalene/phytoene synthase family protein [Acidimicrobiia bacterium]
MQLPFFLRRPWLIVQGTLTNRDKPDIAKLRTIKDPEAFVWAVLPHAARSFAISILVLPRADAWAAAIAYLQCRILDTYEDLYPEPGERPTVLRIVGVRWKTADRVEPPRLGDALVATPRDEVHALLIDRIEMVDAAFDTLPPTERASINELVGNMAEGMAWAAERFASQDGVLNDETQRVRYCNYVIGEPALYAMRSLLHLPITATARSDAMDVSVFIQLANVTRDIEKDLERGVAYDESLRPILASALPPAEVQTAVALARTELMREALQRFPAYARLVDGLPGGINQARGAAVLMLGFTDRYYAGCASRTGDSGWHKRSRAQLYIDGILGSIWPRWAHRAVERSRANFTAFLQRSALRERE